MKTQFDLIGLFLLLVMMGVVVPYHWRAISGAVRDAWRYGPEAFGDLLRGLIVCALEVLEWIAKRKDKP